MERDILANATSILPDYRIAYNLGHVGRLDGYVEALMEFPICYFLSGAFTDEQIFEWLING